MTPMDPTNQSAVISQWIPEGAGSDELGDVDLHRGVGLHQRDADHHQHGGDADAHGVGGTPPGGPASMGPEQERADALAPGRVPHVLRDGRQLGVGGVPATP